jgi:uridine kinase
LAKFSDPEEVWTAIRSRYREQAAYVIAVDGPDCSGKTQLATRLLEIVERNNLEASIFRLDDTFAASAVRPRRNPGAVSEFLLEFFDHAAIERAISSARRILIIEGMFLLRPSLIKKYDFSIRLELDEKSVFERAYSRDLLKFENWGDFALHYVSQSLAAQRLYRSLCEPTLVADLVIELSD